MIGRRGHSLGVYCRLVLSERERGLSLEKMEQKIGRSVYWAEDARKLAVIVRVRK